MTISITGLIATPLGVGALRIAPLFHDSVSGSDTVVAPYDVYTSMTNNRATSTLLGSSSGPTAVDHTGINKGEIWFYWATMDGGASYFPASSIAGIVGLAQFVGADQIAILSSNIGTALTTTTNSGTAISAVATSGTGVNSQVTSGTAIQAGGGAGTAIAASASSGIAIDALSSSGAKTIQSTSSGSGNFAFYAQVFSSAGKYGPFTGAHDGLMRKGMPIETGDIVCDLRVHSRGGVSDTLTEITRSSMSRQVGIVGVFVGRRRIKFTQALLGENGITRQVRKDFDLAVFNGLGQGQINVCAENGPIRPGDLLVSASLPGKAMRQDDDIVRSNTVARAREASLDEFAQIACIYLCG